MAQSDAELMRSVIDQLNTPAVEQLNEVFGRPAGFRELAKLLVQRPFSPDAQWKFMVADYANSLYNMWIQGRPEKATAQDLLDWFDTNQANLLGGSAGMNVVVELVRKVVGNDLSKELSNDHLQKIFLALSNAINRKARGFGQKIISKGSKEQEQQVLVKLDELRKFVGAQGNRLTLNKLYMWIQASFENINTAVVQKAFNQFRTVLSGTPAPLPSPFSPTNNSRLAPAFLNELIPNLDELLLAVVVARDEMTAGRIPRPGGSTARSKATALPPSLDAALRSADVQDWLRAQGII